jgi:hypothetical protein
VVALLLPSAAQAAKSQFTIFEAPRELSSPDPATRAHALDEIKSLGAEWIRVLVYWRNVETQPGAYDFTAYDRILADAQSRGLQVLLVPTGPVPKWASANRRSHTYRPSTTKFERFVGELGRRYGGQISLWAIWNEPNHPDFLTPQFRNGRAYSPGLYRQLFRAARRGLAASGNGGDRVLAGETAPRGTPRVVAPVRFLRGTLCLSSSYRKRSSCDRLDADGWAHHPYTTKSGPQFVPSDRDDVTIGVLSRLTRALDRAARARAIRRRTPVYITEFGIQSEPDPYVGVSETKQAEWRAIAERIAWRNSRVAAFAQYLMRDDLPREGSPYVRYSGFESGLRHSDGRVKLAYDGFRLPLVATSGSKRTTLWGLVRPATGATTVLVEYRDSGKSDWRALKHDSTDAAGYWTTTTRNRKGRSYRVRWGEYAGPRTRAYPSR